jgi:hypothetical protein
MNLKVYYHVEKFWPLDPILSQHDPVNMYFNIHVNTTIQSMARYPNRFLPFKFSDKNFVH